MTRHQIPTIPQSVLDATQQLQHYPYIVDAVLSRWGTLSLQVFLDDLLLGQPDSSTRIFSVEDATVMLQLYSLNAEAHELR